MREITKDKYKSPPAWEPDTIEQKKQCFKIYDAYASQSLTQKQVAEQMNIAHYKVRDAIKWVACQLEDIPPGVELSVMIDQLKERKQEMAERLQAARDTDDKLKLRDEVEVWAEMRRIEKLIAQLRGLLSTSLIDQSDRRQVTVVTQQLDRRKGQDGPEEAKVIEG